MPRNVLGGELEMCSKDPMTGWFRSGDCSSHPSDRGRHTICAVMTAEFLEHQQSIGNDLVTANPQFRFPGLRPGDRWCVTVAAWVMAHEDSKAAPVVLAATNESVLTTVPLELLERYAVDVPDDVSSLEG